MTTQEVKKSTRQPRGNKNNKKKDLDEQMIMMQSGILEEITYIISHDLQVPLISIEGYATELLEAYSNKLNSSGVYCLERMKANAQRMYQLVISLLEISRLNTRKYPHETFDTKEVVKGIVRELSLNHEISEAYIEVEEMPRVRGDKKRLEGVFKRLIVNALVYGGTDITVGCRENTWFVKDNGIGIPPDQLGNIFRSGERLKRVEVEGVGMGLTYCKYVIHQHKGRIWAESDGENKGAVINFTINGET